MIDCNYRRSFVHPVILLYRIRIRPDMFGYRVMVESGTRITGMQPPRLERIADVLYTSPRDVGVDAVMNTTSYNNLPTGYSFTSTSTVYGHWIMPILDTTMSNACWDPIPIIETRWVQGSTYESDSRRSWSYPR